MRCASCVCNTRKTRRHHARAIPRGVGVIQFTVWLLSVHRATLVDRCCFWRNPTHDSPSGTPAAVQLSSITISSSAKRLLAVGTVTPCVLSGWHRERVTLMVRHSETLDTVIRHHRRCKLNSTLRLEDSPYGLPHPKTSSGEPHPSPNIAQKHGASREQGKSGERRTLVKIIHGKKIFEMWWVPAGGRHRPICYTFPDKNVVFGFVSRYPTSTFWTVCSCSLSF